MARMHTVEASPETIERLSRWRIATLVGRRRPSALPDPAPEEGARRDTEDVDPGAQVPEAPVEDAGS